MKRICGIYIIMCKKNNKVYIGQSKDIFYRKNQHFHQLINNTHRNKNLQDDFNKYGYTSFEHFIIKECDESDLYTYENFYINLFGEENAYNIINNRDSELENSNHIYSMVIRYKCEDGLSREIKLPIGVDYESIVECCKKYDQGKVIEIKK